MQSFAKKHLVAIMIASLCLSPALMACGDDSTGGGDNNNVNANENENENTNDNPQGASRTVTLTGIQDDGGTALGGGNIKVQAKAFCPLLAHQYRINRTRQIKCKIAACSLIFLQFYV